MVDNFHIPAIDSNDSKMDARWDIEKFVHNQSSQILDIEIDVLEKNISNCLMQLTEAMGKIDLSESMFDIGSVTFSLAVTASGEVALLSAVKGSVASQAGLQFVLTPKVDASVE